MKRWPTFLASLATLLLLAAAVCGANPFGVVAHLPDEAVLDRIEAAGIGWIRIDVPWALVQPDRNVWDWSAIDPVVIGARARGLAIYATLSTTPAWATDGEPGTGPPRDPADWARFCYRAASRYRGSVTAWGLWNEPNLDRFWTGTRQEYIDRIVLPGARAIHAAVPLATVGAPETAHLRSGHWDRWLRDVIRDAGDEIDVVTHHVYPSNGSHRTVSSALARGPSNPWDDPSVRSVLEDAGWFGRPFWLTETGLASDRYGEQDQANFITNLLDDWFRPGTDLHWLDRIAFYEAADDPGAGHAWGILGPPPEYEPKPAYFAYQDFIASATVADAVLVSAGGPLFLHPGQTTVAHVTFQNTGTVPWVSGEGFRLEALRDPAGLVTGGTDLDPGLTVLPGEQVTFAITLQAPEAAEGPALLVLRMISPEGRRFGDALRALLTVSEDAPPRIVRQPSPHTVPAGTPVRLTVDAVSETPLAFQWQRDGADLSDEGPWSGVRSPTLTIWHLDRETAGDYRCLLTNTAGTVGTVTVSVTMPTTPPRPRTPSGRNSRTTHR